MNILAPGLVTGAHAVKEGVLAYRRIRHRSHDTPGYRDMVNRIDRGMIGLVGVALSGLAIIGSGISYYLGDPVLGNFLAQCSVFNGIPAITDTLTAVRNGNIVLSIENLTRH